MKTRFILIETSHAGNVGAAARAMKVMGFDDLVLVRPRWPDVLQREETLQRASGANEVLARARVVGTLDEALDGVSHLCATAMTPRDFGPPTAAPRPHLAALVQAEPAEAGVAFLFGPERFGMSNADVYRCHVALSIPTDPAFGSLNLAAAIQVIAYEWRQSLGGFGVNAGDPPSPQPSPASGRGGLADPSPQPSPASRRGGLADPLPLPSPARGRGSLAAPLSPRAAEAPGRGGEVADAQSVAGLLAHWERSLVDIGFLDPSAPKKLMPRLNQLFNRARLTPQEVHILRGIAKAMTQAAARGSD